MGIKRHTEEEIIKILRDAETHQLSTDEACRKYSISDATFYKWKKRYGGIDKPEIRRLRELEKENEELKKALGEQVIANNVMQKLIKKKGWD